MCEKQSSVRPLARQVVVAVVVAVVGAFSPPAPGADTPRPKPVMRRFTTPYYTLTTDLDDEMVREAIARTTAMGNEYAARIRGFGARVTRRLPFYLYSRLEDYRNAGGPDDSWGVYTGKKLMAVAEKSNPSRTWSLVQHEGFHQFLDAAMRAKVPVWLNEGLAEYFGNGLWTGDGFVMGAIPTYRLLRVKLQIRFRRLRPLAELLELDDETWNDEMSPRNYDQAWMIVHFLIHGGEGKHHRPFAKFLTDVGAGRPWGAAFAKHLGRDIKALDAECRTWWLARPNRATPKVYATALVQTLTSVLARAVAKRQKITDFDDFLAKATAGTLACRADQWLPPKLLKDALAIIKNPGAWQLRRIGVYPSLVLTDTEGNIYTGSFTLTRGRPANVAVTVTPPRKTRN